MKIICINSYYYRLDKVKTIKSNTLVNLKLEISNITKNLKSFEKKHIPFALSRALNESADSSHTIVLNSMKRIFKKPTPFILNSLRIQRSNKSNLVVVLGFKDTYGHEGSAVENTLNPHIYGKDREPKAYERTLSTYWYIEI